MAPRLHQQVGPIRLYYDHDRPYVIMGSPLGYTWMIGEIEGTRDGYVGEDGDWMHELFCRFVLDLAIEMEDGLPTKQHWADLKPYALRAWKWTLVWPMGPDARSKFMQGTEYLHLLEHVVNGHSPKGAKYGYYWTKRYRPLGQ